MRDSERALDWMERHLRALGDDVVRETRKTHVRYKRDGEVFAVLRPLKTRVDVGFNRLGRARSKRIRSARNMPLPGVRYRVPIEHPGDVDTELLAWVEESYVLAAAPSAAASAGPAASQAGRAESAHRCESVK